MSRTNENKLKMKDIATIGIFSALLFVVTMVAGALMGISMVLNMYSVAVVAVLSAPLYMLIMAKVHKKGAVLLTFAIVGILWGLFGGIFVLIWMLGFGVCSGWFMWNGNGISSNQNAYAAFISWHIDYGCSLFD